MKKKRAGTRGEKRTAHDPKNTNLRGNSVDGVKTTMNNSGYRAKQPKSGRQSGTLLSN